MNSIIKERVEVGDVLEFVQAEISKIHALMEGYKEHNKSVIAEYRQFARDNGLPFGHEIVQNAIYTKSISTDDECTKLSVLYNIRNIILNGK